MRKLSFYILSALLLFAHSTAAQEHLKQSVEGNKRLFAYTADRASNTGIGIIVCIVQLDQSRGNLGAPITTIHTKELPEVAIVLGDAGCTIVSGDSIVYVDEFDLFSELEKLKT